MSGISTVSSAHLEKLFDALEDRSLVYVHLPFLVRPARALLADLLPFLRAQPLQNQRADPRDMFPSRLESSPQLCRRVLAFPGADSVPEELRSRLALLSERFTVFADGLLTYAAKRYEFSASTETSLLDHNEWRLAACDYPPREGAEDPICFPAQRDLGLFAFTVGDEGFEVCLDHQWQAIPSSEDVLPIHAGLTLEQLTGRRIRSILHRCAHPPRSSLVFYGDAPRDLQLPDGKTVAAFIAERQYRSGQR